jgi:hypothetical protein
MTSGMALREHAGQGCVMMHNMDALHAAWLPMTPMHRAAPSRGGTLMRAC